MNDVWVAKELRIVAKMVKARQEMPVHKKTAFERIGRSVSSKRLAADLKGGEQKAYDMGFNDGRMGRKKTKSAVEGSFGVNAEITGDV